MPRLINYHRDPVPEDGIWITRGKSVLANRWSHLPCIKPIYQCIDRYEALDKYYNWLYNKVFVQQDDNIIESLYEIKEESVLICCCTPLACHGDIVIEIWRELNASRR